MMLRAALMRSASSSRARSCEADKLCLGATSVTSRPGVGDATFSQSAENSGEYLSMCLSRGGPPRAIARISAVPISKKQAVCQQL